MRTIRPKEEACNSPTASPNVAPPFNHQHIMSTSSNGSLTTSTNDNNSSSSSKRRKCISSACLPCRKRKSKCDGSLPSCNPCAVVHHTPCEYDVDSDHRRKAALKRDIQTLKEENEAGGRVLLELKTRSFEEAVSLLRGLRKGEDLEGLVGGLMKREGKQDPVSRGTNGEQVYDESELGGGEEDGEEMEEEADPDVKNEEAALSMDEKGVRRHFGHTSNLGLVTHQEFTHPPGLPSQTSNPEPEWESMIRGDELVKHLLDVYFCWVHPYYGTFSREAFYISMKERNSTYCSELLINSILAVACHYSDRAIVRRNPTDPNTAGDEYFDRAKYLLFQDESSRLTTVQALGLMSVREILAGRDSSGYAYIARAAHMALELGLHLKLEGNGHKLSGTESEVRKITFWSLFHYETCWAVALGRPTQLPNNAINVGKPRVVKQYDERPWYPCTGFGMENGPGAGQPCVKSTFQDQIYKLSEIINDMVVAFYAPRERFTSRKLLDLYKRYQAWYEKLPTMLALQSITLPHVLCLHMYYHTCLIHLFRAFIKVSLIRSNVSPRTICTSSASEIGRLFAIYRQVYTLRRSSIICSHVILTSSIIDLINLPSNPTAAVNLAQAIEIMREASINNQFFTRDLVVLLALAKEWCIKLPPTVQTAAFGERPDLPAPNDRPIKATEAYLPTQSAFHFFPPTPGQTGEDGKERGPEVQYYTDPSVHMHSLNTHHPQYRADASTNATASPAPTTAGHQQQHQHQQHQHQQSPHPHPTHQQPHYDVNGTAAPHLMPGFVNHPNLNPTPTDGTPISNADLFWSPFPDQGLPLQNSVAQRGSTMDIARVVDDMAGWDQLNRDGFEMAEMGGAGMGMADLHQHHQQQPDWVYAHGGGVPAQGHGGDVGPGMGVNGNGGANGVDGYGMGIGGGWSG